MKRKIKITIPVVFTIEYDDTKVERQALSDAIEHTARCIPKAITRDYVDAISPMVDGIIRWGTVVDMDNDEGQDSEV